MQQQMTTVATLDSPEVSEIRITVTLVDGVKPSRVVIEKATAKWLAENGFHYIQYCLGEKQ